jgi:hypothetical protein
MPQDTITDGISVSGTLTCEGCQGTLIVRIEDASSQPPQLLTSASFDAPGAYTMKAPKGKQAVLMVIHDENGDGQPTPGENIGIWTGGLLETNTDQADIDLAVGVMPETPPIAPEGDPPAPTEIPPEAPAEIPAEVPAEAPQEEEEAADVAAPTQEVEAQE